VSHVLEVVKVSGPPVLAVRDASDPQPTMLLLGSLFQPAATWRIWYFAARFVDYMAPAG